MTSSTTNAPVVAHVGVVPDHSDSPSSLHYTCHGGSEEADRAGADRVGDVEHGHVAVAVLTNDVGKVTDNVNTHDSIQVEGVLHGCCDGEIGRHHQAA